MKQQWIQFIPQVMRTLAETYHGRGSVELGDPLKVLIATVISQRTREEQTSEVTERLFSRFPNAEALANAPEAAIFDALQGATFPEAKAPRIKQIARILVEKYGGRVPNTREELLALPGVGPKTANCVLLYAFEIPALCVDTHMHRITNRLGWVDTQRPEQTEAALEKILPHEYWSSINRLMLQHGRAICTYGVPACSICPIRSYCRYGNDSSTPKR